MDLGTFGTYIKNSVVSRVNALLPSQGGNSGKYLTTNGASLSWGAVGSSTPTVNTSLTSLTIDCSVADIFRIPISANANFVISNASGEKSFRVKNTSAGTITVTMPNGQIYSNQFVDIAAGKARIFKLSVYGSQYEWLVSGELANV